MKSALTKRVLDMLEKLAKDKPEDYKKFWSQFGQVLKEGPAEDFANKEKIAGLLRFASTSDTSGEQSVSLADYLGRMKEGQDKIYYLTGESYAQVKNSPHLEVFRKKGIEVLLLTDRIDEWLMSYLTEFDGKQFVDVARGDLDLGKLDSEEDKKAQEEIAKAKEGLIERLKGRWAKRWPRCGYPTASPTRRPFLPLASRISGCRCARFWRRAGRRCRSPSRSSRSIRSTR